MNSSRNHYEECVTFFILNEYISEKYKNITDPFYMVLYLANIGWSNISSSAAQKAVYYVESKLNGGEYT